MFSCGPHSCTKPLWPSANRATSSGPASEGISESVSLSLIAFGNAISSTVGTQSSELTAPEPCLHTEKRVTRLVSIHYCSIIDQLARPRRLDHLLRKMTCRNSFTHAFAKLWPRRIGWGRLVPLASGRIERPKLCIVAIQQDIWIVNRQLHWGQAPLGFVSSSTLDSHGSGIIIDLVGLIAGHLYALYASYSRQNSSSAVWPIGISERLAVFPRSPLALVLALRKFLAA